MTQDPDPYTPMEAADRLGFICDELQNYNVAAEHIEKLRVISQRFTRHLNQLVQWQDRLQSEAGRFYPW